MKIFSWKATKFSADAQLVGAELEKIEERDGTLEAEALVSYAEKNKNSELHKCFEWNDKEASRKYRLVQARLILCSISIEIKEEPKKTQRVYVSIKDKDTEERNFKNIKDVLEDDEEYLQLVDKARADLNRCKEKYDDLVKKDDLKDIIFEIYRNI